MKKSNLKSLFVIFLLLTLTFTLTACDSGGSNPTNQDETMAEVTSSGDLQKTLDDKSVNKIILTDDITGDIYFTKNVRDLDIVSKSEAGYQIDGDLVVGNGEETIDVAISNIDITGDNKLIVNVNQGDMEVIDSNIDNITINSVGSNSFKLRNSRVTKMRNNASEARIVLDNDSEVDTAQFNAPSKVEGGRKIKKAEIAETFKDKVDFGEENDKPDEIDDTLPEWVELTIAGGATGAEMETTYAAAKMYMKENPEVTVNVVGAPDLSNNRLGYYLDKLNKRSSEIDLYQIDIVWPGELEGHFLDLNEYGASNVAADHFEQIIDNNTVGNKLVALPWFTDVGLLYYRTDLLEKYDRQVPTTWDELEETAKYIMEKERAAGNEDFYGYVWQGDAYEGLTCDALEWIYSNDGGKIIDDNGQVTINNQKAIEIIDQAAGWVGDISPNEVLNMGEEDAREMWENGNALFMRNWPYAYSLGNQSGKETAGNFSVAPLPTGDSGKPAGTLGGWNLAVSKYSDHPEAAAKLAMFMAGEKVQKMRALEAGLNPTIESLYNDPEVTENKLLYSEIEKALTNSVARPSTETGQNYSEVSRLFFQAVHSVLSGEVNASTTLNDLEVDLQNLLN